MKGHIDHLWVTESWHRCQNNQGRTFKLLFQLYSSQSYAFSSAVCLVVSGLRTPWTICSPPGSSVHGDSPGKKSGVGGHALLQGIFPTQGSNPCLPHCRCSQKFQQTRRLPQNHTKNIGKCKMASIFWIILNKAFVDTYTWKKLQYFT